MPNVFKVPASVSEIAARALTTHRDHPLDDVSGVALAERLTSGEITLEDLRKMRRFFLVNERQYRVDEQMLRTVENAPTVRSWHLHGSEAGRVWAARVSAPFVEEDATDADLIDTLFSKKPDEIYDLFSLNGWRVEYGLDVPKAARFVEQYHRATGWILDLPRAFGESAPAIGRSMYRRAIPKDPYKVIAECLKVRDLDYRFAAELDLAAMNQDGALHESIFPQAAKIPDKTAAKIVWAPFVAYFILAVEKPELLDTLNGDSAKPPTLAQKPKSYIAYHDAINIFVTYFHPEGARWVKVTEKYADLPNEMADAISRAYFGKKLLGKQVQKMLGAARRWTAENKLAGSLFHVFIADWKKANWQHILENIPDDADVRPFFEQFVAANPMPADGVKLQQTLTDKKVKAAVINFLEGEFSVDPDDIDPVKVNATAAGKKAAEMGTPFGVWSLLADQGMASDVVFLGAWRAKGGPGVIHVFQRVADGSYHFSTDEELESEFEDGEVTVKLAHKDMPGSFYSGGGDTQPSGGDETAPTTLKGEALPQDLLDDLGGEVIPLPGGAWTESLFTKAWEAAYGTKLRKGSPVEFVPHGDPFEMTFWGQYEVPAWGSVVVLFKTSEEIPGTVGGFFWQTSKAASISVKNGDLRPPVKEEKPSMELGVPKTMGAGTSVLDQEPTEQKPEPEQVPGFKWGDILGIKTERYMILAYDATEHTVHTVRLQVQTYPTADFLPLTDEYVLKNAIKLGVYSGLSSIKPSWLESKYPENPVIDVPQQWGQFDVGKGMVVGGRTLVAALEVGGGRGIPVMAKRQQGTVFGSSVSYPSFTLGDIFELADAANAENSYNPPEDVPENDLDADTPDPEQGNFEMAGTQEAFTLIANRAALDKPATKSESPLFEWDLGDVLWYNGGPNRTIVGYAFGTDGTPVYVIRTEKGNYNTKSAVAGNQQYGPKQGADQDVVKALLPKPGVEAQVKFPKLNYHLSHAAKEYAKVNKVIFVKSPRGFPFNVGSFMEGPKSLVWTTGKWRLQAWLPPVAEGGDPRALCSYMHEDESLDWRVFPSDTVSNWTIWYETLPLFDPAEGTINFSKKGGAGEISMTDPTIPMVEGMLPSEWFEPEAISEPAVDSLPPGTHLSAGIVAIIPEATTVYSDVGVGPGEKAPMEVDSVLLYKPLGGFGGYKLAFPKGTVEKGEPMLKAAVREVYEETGLAVKPVAHLGDFKGNTSMNRMYIGYILGGHPQLPKKTKEEADAVMLRPLWPLTAGAAPWEGDLIPQSDNKWQQVVLKAAKAWVSDNGLPNLYAPETPAATGSPPPVAATDAGAGVTTFDPNKKVEIEADNVAKMTAATIDYDVNDSVKLWAATLAGLDSDWWFFLKSVEFINMGYPPVGAQFELPTAGKAKGGSQYAQAYIVTVVKNAETGLTAFTHTLLSMLESGKYVTHVIRVTNDGVKWKTFLTPIDFKPVAKPSSPAQKSITAPAKDAEIWKQFLFGAEYPVSATMLTALKNKCSALGILPEQFMTARNLSGGEGPAYGDFFTTPAQTPMTAVGYVSITDVSGQSYPYLFGMTPSGIVEVLPADAATLKGYVVDPDQTAAETGTVPWFEHPDQTVMEIMKKVYVAGGDLKALGFKLSDFKKWIHTAKVPSWNLCTTVLVGDVAALFVPGVASEAQKDIVISCLKAKHKATATGKKKEKEKPTAGGSNAVSETPPPVGTAMVSDVQLAFSSPVIKSYVANPQPALFQKTGQGMPGGSKPNMVLDGPGGRWLFKYAPGEDVRAAVDAASYQLMSQVKGNAVPVGMMEFDGKLGSFQPVIDDAVSPPGDPTTLTDDQMAELLAQHAYDMFVGDHDGHAGNWLMSNGNLVAIDRGQSFKFLLQGKPESLDPTWHAPGNYGKGYAKTLLIQWGQGFAEIPDKAFAAMAKVVGKVMGLPDATLAEIIAPVFEKAKVTDTKQKTILKALYKRRDNYEKDWTNVLTKLRGDFKWPVAPKKKKPKQLVLKSSPKEMGIDATTELTIAEASERGQQGKSIKVDSWAIENQEVMVRKVQLVSQGVNVAATLLTWRVGHDAGIQATKTLANISKLVASTVTDDVGGPHPLQVDVNNSFWDKILTAVKSINHHLVTMSPEPDLKPNQSSVNAALGLKSPLEQLVGATKDFAGKTLGDPNEVVNAMAQQYLQYLEIVEGWNAQATELKGKPTPTFHQFMYEEPEEDRRREAVKEKPAYEVTFKKSGSTFPNVQFSSGAMTVSDFNKPIFSSDQPRFFIHDKTANLRIQFMPPPVHAGNIAVGGGVKGHHGVCWAVMAGEPGPAVVAHVMKVFQDATGLSMKMATALDNEVLYYSQQLAVLQNGGVPTPNPSTGTIVNEPEYQFALQQYRDGNADAALKTLKIAVAKKVGTTPEKLGAQADLDGVYTRGGGHRRFLRIGWDRAKLVKTLGPDRYLAHGLYNMTVLDFLKAAQTNLALVANNQKMFQGTPVKGGSPKSDFTAGGTQGLFGCWRHLPSPQAAASNTLYFDVSVGLRLDVYMVGTGDTYGNQYEYPRYATPESWRKSGGINSTGSVGPGSHRQMNIRHDIDLQEYLQFGGCHSETERQACIALSKKMGWTFYGGKSPEDTFVVA